MWGSQWDAVMRWRYNSGDADKKRYTYDSTGKGNCGTDSTISTGLNSTYAVNNIYDMAGNVYEWTIESLNVIARITRGGSYFYNGSDHTASSRYDGITPDGSLIDCGSRSALYIM